MIGCYHVAKANRISQSQPTSRLRAYDTAQAVTPGNTTKIVMQIACHPLLKIKSQMTSATAECQKRRQQRKQWPKGAQLMMDKMIMAIARDPLKVKSHRT